jgi:hypothetical protein
MARYGDSYGAHKYVPTGSQETRPVLLANECRRIQIAREPRATCQTALRSAALGAASDDDDQVREAARELLVHLDNKGEVNS